MAKKINKKIENSNSKITKDKNDKSDEKRIKENVIKKSGKILTKKSKDSNKIISKQKFLINF